MPVVSRFVERTCAAAPFPGDAAWEVIDFAPRIRDGLAVRAPIATVRLLRPCAVIPRCASTSIRAPTTPASSRGSARSPVASRCRAVPIHLSTNCSLAYLLNRSDFVLHEPLFFVLSRSAPEEAPTLASVQHDLEATTAG